VPFVRVARATLRDLPCVVRLQKQHAAALGFLPRAALREKIESGRIWVARDGNRGGSAAGFLHHGSLARPEVRVFQAAVRLDARRRHVGSALVDDLLRRAAAAGAAGVSLRCLASLDANRFWAAAGFRLLGTEPGGHGTLNVWVKRLNARPGDGFAFHSRVHPCPGCRTPTVDTWVRGTRRLSFCPACVAAAGRN
jgi:GNAT superfamily N-acetyltransferase